MCIGSCASAHAHATCAWHAQVLLRALGRMLHHQLLYGWEGWADFVAEKAERGAQLVVMRKAAATEPHTPTAHSSQCIHSVHSAPPRALLTVHCACVLQAATRLQRPKVARLFGQWRQEWILQGPAKQSGLGRRLCEACRRCLPE